MPGEYGTAYAVGRSSDIIPIGPDGRRDPNSMYPVRIQCAKCPNRTTKYVKVRTMYAYPRGHPAIAKTGADRQIVVELWCLSCVRAGNVEDDSYRTNVSIAQS